MPNKQNSLPNEGPSSDDLNFSLAERIKDPEFLRSNLDAYCRATSETQQAYELLVKRLELPEEKKRCFGRKKYFWSRWFN